MQWRRPLLATCACAVAAASWAAEQAPAFPEPLTLEYALSLADEAHPQIRVAQAELKRAEAEQLDAQSQTGVNAQILGRLQWVEPSPVAEQYGSQDNQLGLIITKTLYDFGRSSASRAAAKNSIETQNWYYLEARQRRRIEIMRLFFEVLLSDLRFYRDNEAMAVVFVELDRRRDRRELGQVSDLQVLEQESLYQQIRRRRYNSETQQRVARTRLAQVLNRADSVPATLAPPALPYLQRKLPELEFLQQEALANNPRLHALRAELASAQERVAAARASDSPRLIGHVEAYDYSRQFGRDDTYRAGVTLEVPLLTGGRADAEAAREQAELYRLDADAAQAELDVRLTALELWQKLDTLRLARDEAQAEVDYRDLSLDHARGLYELEVKTDLGDAMVRVTDAQLQAMQTAFETALTWAQVDALTGRMALDNPLQTPAPPARGETGELPP